MVRNVTTRPSPSFLSITNGAPFRSEAMTSHAKFTVADETVLVGSHNVSGNSLTCETQDSVFVESASLAAYLRGEFERQWIAARLEHP